MPRTIALVAAFLCLTVAYVILFGQIPRDYASASIYLAGIDLIHGNWRLENWWLAPDPFLTSDIVVYGVAHLIFGYHIAVLLYVPAALWAGLVLLACATASTGMRPRDRGWIVACVLTLLGLLIFERNPVMEQISFAPMHVASLCFVLAMFLWSESLLSGREENGLTRLGCIGVATFLAVAGDPMVVVIGAVPVLATAALSQSSSGSRRAAVGATVGAACIAAKAFLAVNMATGGAKIVESEALSLSFAPFAQISTNIGYVFKNLLSIFGANFLDSKVMAALPELSRLVLLLAAVISTGSIAVDIWVRLRSILEARTSPTLAVTRRPLDMMLALAIVLNLAAVVLSRAVFEDYSAARYLFPVLVFGSILAGRWTPGHRGMKAAIPVAAALSMFTVVQHYWSGPRHIVWTLEPVQEVADWLRQHRQHYGYGPFALASLATVLNHGSVALRPVRLGLWGWESDQIVAMRWLSSATWYPAPFTSRKPDFVVVDPAPGAPFSGRSVTKTFGAPKSIARVAGYLIYIYKV